jgi:hypothetical protein
MVTNPAQTIYDIYEKLAAICVNDFTLYVAWSKVLDVDPNDYPEVYLQLIGMKEIIQATKKIVQQQFPEQADFLLMHYPSVESLLQPSSLQVPMRSFGGNFSEVIMQSLKGCAMFVKPIENSIDIEQLKQLDIEVRELIEWVAESNIPEDIKGSVLKSLESISRAIRDRRFKGVSGLDDALTVMTGTIARQGQNMSNYPELKGRLWSVISRLSDIISVATVAQQSLPTLAPFIEKLLGP